MTETKTPLVRREQLDSGVLRLTLNQPDRYNALSAAMLQSLRGHLDELRRDTSVRVVIISGAGRGFSAGHDLAEMHAHRDQSSWQAELFSVCSQVMQAITHIAQPVIAQVHGVATAAGLQLAATCDLVVCAQEARFALPGVNVGIFCSTPAVAVGRRIGPARTMELLLTGTPIDAETALRWGLVNRVASAETLDQVTLELARDIAAHSAAVVGRGKATFYAQMQEGAAAAYDLAANAMVCDVTGPDAAEGMAAFMEKRPPSWPSQ